MTTTNRRGISSCTLHLLAMALMLCDHLWATVFPAQEWLSCIGRMAFPIFAFLIAEGYARTSDLGRYLRRLLIFALLSEIPFDLVYGSTVFYPFHQNVLWTFLIALGTIVGIERAKRRENWTRIPLAALAVLGGGLLGTVTMTDYYGAGVWTVLVFYFFRGEKWWQRLAQLFCLAVVNLKLLGGYYYVVTIAGREFEIVQQGFALLALLPIWLYDGRQGHHSRAFRWGCYAFYPLHLLVLYLLWQAVL